MVTQSQLNGINNYNSEIKKHLEQRNGINWFMKFEQEVDSIMKIK